MSAASQSYDLTTPYVPSALYFHEADFVEYVREDASCVYKRIDETLTLALEMDTRLPVGFRIKGFRNLFLKIDPDKRSEGVFIKIIDLLEQAACNAGNEFFSRMGYRAATDIAKADHVEICMEDLAA